MKAKTEPGPFRFYVTLYETTTTTESQLIVHRLCRITIFRSFFFNTKLRDDLSVRNENSTTTHYDYQENNPSASYRDMNLLSILHLLLLLVVGPKLTLQLT